MNLRLFTIPFLILGCVNKAFTQGIPKSPCPGIFQYRFDGSEWFGLLSVRNPEYGEPLVLHITLSLTGKPVTNYLGEIQMITRGQFATDAPVLYKVKFPKNHIPPHLLYIKTNNQLICVGPPDHQAFLVTLIQLEHTRRLEFIRHEMEPSTQSASSSSAPDFTQTVEMSTGPSTTVMNEFSMLPTNTEFDTKHLPFANTKKSPMRKSKDICGTIDKRIRRQVLQAQRQAKVSTFAFPSRSGFENSANANDNRSNGEDEDISVPSIITMATGSDSELEELPSITRGTWPWLAAVYVNNLTSLVYQCGGTLVSDRVVISAAHCFHLFNQRYSASEVLVFLGRHNLKNWNEEGSSAAAVDDIFIHPEFHQNLHSFDADIAVVFLKNEVRFNSFIRPGCLWSDPTKQELIEGKNAVLVGWNVGGFDINKPSSTSNPVPRVVNVPIVSKKICFRADSKYQSLSSDRTFCAGAMLQNNATTTTNKHRKDKQINIEDKLHRGPCTGDSGAGLMILKNNRWVLRGLVSGALPLQSAENDSPPSMNPKCSIKQFVIYTDVAKFLDWIFAFII